MRKLLVIAALLALVAVSVTAGIWYNKLVKNPTQEYAYAKGVDAAAYSFPYFLNSVLLNKWSKPPVEGMAFTPSAAVNQFWHLSEMPSAEDYRDGGGPNQDTLYSVAFIYVGEEPIVMSVPPVPDERYYTFEIAGFDSDNFAYIGKRTHGNLGGNYAIVPPGWGGVLPADVQQLAEAPTPWIIVVGRTLIDPNNPDDLQAVNALQAQYRITHLPDWGIDNPPLPPHPPLDGLGALLDPYLADGAPKLIRKVALQDPMLFWQVVNWALDGNGVPARDQSRLPDWATLELGPGQDLSTLDDDTREGLSQSVMQGIRILQSYPDSSLNPGRRINGWRYPAVHMGRSGVSGHYLNRSAVQSMMGIISNDPEEAVYMGCRDDQFGERLDGGNQYRVHFAAGQLPPAREFWSLTAYDEDFNLIINPLNRHAVGDRSDHLEYDADGGLSIYLGPEPPAGKQGNWLPLVEGNVTLVLRMYGPGDKVLSQTWNPPQVRRL